ncbi:MAG: hypothetical protein RI564_00820 [Gracilimonas sp.]|nr:hypothetical protein [Gracilimonas sp.]
MKKIRHILFIGVFILTLPLSVSGQSLSNIAGAFVDIGYGSRASGMGFAYTGLAEGSDAIVWNPAGMGQAKQINISLMYAKQYDLVNYNYASGIVPLKNGHVVGLAVVSSGDEVLRENTLYASYAKQLKRFYVGATLKYRLSSFGNNNLSQDDYVVFTPAEIQDGTDRQIYGTGMGIGFDVGLLFKLSPSLQFGVIARDPYSMFTWDSKIRGDEESSGSYNETVPFELVVGASYNLGDHLHITTDVLPSLDHAGEEIIRAGVEKKFMDVLYLRVGTEQKLKSLEIDHYMGGFGIEAPKFSGTRFSAHYTYVMNELANTHRIGIQVKL